MPRKKSASGRSRGVSDVSKIMLQAERVNKRFRSLEKAGLYGTYKSKELQEFVSRQPSISIVRSKQGRHKLVLNTRKLKSQDAMLIVKKLKEILGSVTFTVGGIKRVREETREKVTQTIKERGGEDVTYEDIDSFYKLAQYADRVKQESIFDYITPSDFQYICFEGRRRGYNAQQFVDELLVDYVEIKNKSMRREAEYLYNKYYA